MKRFTESTALKIAAVFFSYVFVVVFVLSACATVAMGYYKFYFSNEETVKEEIMTDMAQTESHYLTNLMYSGVDLEKYYSDKNIFYEIHDIRKGTVETNYNGEAYIAEGINEEWEFIEKSKYDEIADEVIYYEEQETIYEIKVYVAENMTKNDIFSVTLKIIEWGFKFEYVVIIVTLISLVILITLICYLFCAAGHRKGGTVAANYLDKIPFDIYTAVVIAAAIFSIFLFSNVGFYNLTRAVICAFLIGSVDYFIALLYLLSFATRIKTRTIIKNNVIYYIFRFFGRRFKKFFLWLKYIFSNLNLIYKTIFVLAGFLLIEAIGLIIIINSFYYFDAFIMFLILIPINIIFILAVLYLGIIMQRIKVGGEKIAGGELEHKIDTSYMFGDFKDFSESLNNINEGLQNAVNEKMKSERFKTELITNVSHDIKTPLTSIVNYVDLIKKEPCDNEKINEYIEVLDRHSLRLKKLVEDLVEASKASTGNLSVNLMPCDVRVLLNQTIGEFEDRLKSIGVEPIVKLPEMPVRIMADGRHLWRVFDNLMNNVCKYALSGTRVYLDLKNQEGKAVITFRNISKYSLNISADELMERFVRGDSSRNTEGSGLGLSIAKSLVELQNGSMDLSVDGDLFKVSLTFSIIKE